MIYRLACVREEIRPFVFPRDSHIRLREIGPAMRRSIIQARFSRRSLSLSLSLSLSPARAQGSPYKVPVQELYARRTAIRNRKASRPPPPPPPPRFYCFWGGRGGGVGVGKYGGDKNYEMLSACTRV